MFDIYARIVFFKPKNLEENGQILNFFFKNMFSGFFASIWVLRISEHEKSKISLLSHFFLKILYIKILPGTRDLLCCSSELLTTELFFVLPNSTNPIVTQITMSIASGIIYQTRKLTVATNWSTFIFETQRNFRAQICKKYFQKFIFSY